MSLLRAGSCNTIFSTVSTLYGPEVGAYWHQTVHDHRQPKITAVIAIQLGCLRLTTKIPANFSQIFYFATSLDLIAATLVSIRTVNRTAVASSRLPADATKNVIENAVGPVAPCAAPKRVNARNVALLGWERSGATLCLTEIRTKVLRLATQDSRA